MFIKTFSFDDKDYVPKIILCKSVKRIYLGKYLQKNWYFLYKTNK